MELATLSKIITITVLFTLMSCGENGLLQSGNSNATNGTSQWDIDKFPLTMEISDEFSDDEISGMKDVGNSWSEAQGEINFFSFKKGKKKEVTDLGQYSDQTFGIYKMHTKLPEFPDRALAITQIYADRVNYSGKSYLSINHADIIVNYAEFTFSSSSSFGSYDLQTVILHELGHFIGLNHFQDPVTTSIMEPSIDTYDRIHYPYPKDTELIQANYQSQTSESKSALTAGRSIASLSESDTQIVGEETENGDGPQVVEKNVRIVHLLRADKECEHYENGKLILKHKTK